MFKRLQQTVEEQADARVRSGRHSSRNVARYVDAVLEFAWIIKAAIVGEPEIAGFENAFKTYKVGVVVQGLGNRSGILFGQKMRPGPIPVPLERLLKLRWHGGGVDWRAARRHGWKSSGGFNASRSLGHDHILFASNARFAALSSLTSSIFQPLFASNSL